MTKTQKIIFACFVALLLLLTFLEASEPEPINWNPSYSENDKIPLGTYVLFSNLEKSNDLSISKINRPPYEELISSELNGTYFFLNETIPFDEAELKEILQWVEKGNELFVSGKHISENLLDTLNLETKFSFSINTTLSQPLLQLANPNLKNNRLFLFDHDTDIPFFSKVDTLKTTILGYSAPFNDELQMKERNINFVQTDFGKGKIFIHLAPEAFSNYFMLKKDNFYYTAAALSYLEKTENLYWDGYYKAGKSFHTSPLYILLNNKKLKWAYYFLLFGCVLFVIFEGKRKQRSIPIVEPLENQTYNYTRTIAGLYLEKKQYRQIALKKIKLFLEYLRTQLRLDTNKIDSVFFETAAARSGNSVDETKELFKYIAVIQSKQQITRKDLLELSEKINGFKK